MRSHPPAPIPPALRAAQQTPARCRAGQVSLSSHPPIAQPSLTPCHSTPPQLHERSTFLPHQREATWQGTIPGPPQNIPPFSTKYPPCQGSVLLVSAVFCELQQISGEKEREKAPCQGSALPVGAKIVEKTEKRTAVWPLSRKCASCWAKQGRNLLNQRWARAAAEKVEGCLEGQRERRG